MKITAKTRIFGIIGHPVSHSLSPIMHNQAMQAMNYAGVYLAFDVKDPGQALNAASTLGIKGLSVTIPHKVTILPALTGLDALAQKIGAVNTVVYESQAPETKQKTKKSPGWYGYNSDAWGALRALRHAIFDRRLENICILGYGGAARAIAHILSQEYKQAQISIAGRDSAKANALISHLSKTAAGHIAFFPWEKLNNAIVQNFDLIVNATPQGMSSHNLASPIPAKFMHKEQIIFDTVYAPRQTQLLQFAQDKQATIVEGLDMLLYQGVFQFEKFTGLTAPVSIMRDALINLIENNGKQ